MSYKTVTFIGTSITQGFYDHTGAGWFVRLIEKLNSEKPASYYLSNLAQSGDRSYDFLHRLCGEAIQRQSDSLIIEVSCNDIIRQGSPDAECDLSVGLRHELWNSIIRLAKKNFSEIYITSGLPQNEPRMAQTRTPDWNVWYKNEDIIAYNAMIENLCAAHNIPFINLFSMLNSQTYLDTLDDAVHLNTDGHIMIADAAYKKFKELGF